MTANEILKQAEDANEYHFHDVDRKWIIEAMEAYAQQNIPEQFRTLESIIKWVQFHMPFAVNPAKKSKHVFVDAFTSQHAMKVVCETFAQEIFETLNIS